MMDQRDKKGDMQEQGLELNHLAATKTTLRMEVAALSDVGYRRSNNEDSFGYDSETNIFVVCDGMGGLAAGEIASDKAVDLTLKTYNDLTSQEINTEQRLRSAIDSANETVWNMAQQDYKLRGMGTTLVAAAMLENKVIIGNVGDSRAYFLRDGDCVQITEDHSYIAEQLRRGGPIISDEASQRLRQFITRAVGVHPNVEPDFFALDLKPADMILLTTDGLTRYADANKLAHHIYMHSNIEDICRGLIAIAHEGGAEDNITCMLLRFS
ncbi:PP2C family protein-serine/threonine phosphatase [Edaphobacter modestus]|uniref:Protein phosphatase n=1 Tax=Edaphobacter modestus TaxID=388466 RepID=A0A4Q7YXR9_9BACT|nr:protein phosphatase 2C domain-containing protein [Edaphobacter modestus]RZU42254.1 protein phosphatase [Edaphobacter modestus]